MAQRRVLRFELEITDDPQEIAAGKVVALVPHRDSQYIFPSIRLEVWIDATLPENWPKGKHQTQLVAVYPTGHVIPAEYPWLATVVDGPAVWHLFGVKKIGGHQHHDGLET